MKKFLIFLIMIFLVVGIAEASCRQESANVSRQMDIDGICNQQYTGTYTFDGTGGGTWSNLENAYDGNYDTYAGGSAFNTYSLLYINYTKPSLYIPTNSTYWLIKTGAGSFNLGIGNCIDTHADTIELMVNHSCYGVLACGESTQFYCNNGTDWHELTQLNSGSFYEESIWWELEAPVVETVELLNENNETINDTIFTSNDNIYTWCNSTSTGAKITPFVNFYKRIVGWGDILLNNTIIDNGKTDFIQSFETNLENYTFSKTDPNFYYNRTTNWSTLGSYSLVMDTSGVPALFRGVRIYEYKRCPKAWGYCEIWSSGLGSDSAGHVNLDISGGGNGVTGKIRILTYANGKFTTNSMSAYYEPIISSGNLSFDYNISNYKFFIDNITFDEYPIPVDQGINYLGLNTSNSLIDAGDYYWSSCTTFDGYSWGSKSTPLTKVYDIDYTNLTTAPENSFQDFYIEFIGYNPTNATLEFWENNTYLEDAYPKIIWLFNTGSGSTAYDTMGNYNGTIFGANWTTDAIVDYALDFEADDSEYTDFGTTLTALNTDPMTISVWVKRESTGTVQAIVGKQLNAGTEEGIAVEFDADDNIVVTMRQSGANQLQVETQNNYTNTTEWYHIVVTYDGSESASGVHVYVDGVDQTMNIIEDSLSTEIVSGAILSVGSRNGADRFFDGIIDQVGLWIGVAFDQEDVNKAYGEPELQYLDVLKFNMTEVVSGYFESTVNIPNVDADTTYNYKFEWYDDIGLRSILQTLLVQNFEITTTGTNPILNITFYDEETEADISTGMEMLTIFDILFPDGTTETQSFTTTGAVIFYVNVTEIQVTTDVKFQYSKINYAEREYYLDDFLILENQPLILEFFDGLSADVSGAIITIKDEALDIISDAYIYAQRFYSSSNTYKTVIMGKTDDNGQDTLYLFPNTQFYKFIIIKDGEIIKTIDPMKITSNEVTFYVNLLSTEYDAFSEYDSTYYNVVYNNLTNVITSNFIATGGLFDQYCLDVMKESGVNSFEVCNPCDSGSAITLTCVLPDNSSYYSVKVYSLSQTGFMTNLYNSYLDLTEGSAETLGNFGIYLTLFIVLLIGMVGIFNPIASIVSYIVAIIGAYFIGILDIPSGVIITLALVGVIVVWRIRK